MPEDNRVWPYWVYQNMVVFPFTQNTVTTTYTAEPVWHEWMTNQTVVTPVRLNVTATQYRAAERERKMRREEGAKKATELLLKFLSPEQRAMYEAAERFHVRGSDGGLYEIRLGSHGNVYRREGDTFVERLCCQPNDYTLPFADVVLLQKLAIETDEKHYRKIANITDLRPYSRVA